MISLTTAQGQSSLKSAQSIHCRSRFAMEMAVIDFNPSVSCDGVEPNAAEEKKNQSEADKSTRMSAIKC